MAEIGGVTHELRVKKSLVTLSNASELVAQLVISVVGNDISDSLKGSRVTTDMIKTMAQNRFVNSLTSAN